MAKSTSTKKGTPLRNGSGNGTGNTGRGGCATPKRPNQSNRKSGRRR